jgi:hypothetical protein
MVFCFVQNSFFGQRALQSQEILNRPVFVLDILKRVWKFWKLLQILKRFWKDSEHYWKFWTDSEHCWKFWTDSEDCWKFWTDSENSEQILNIIFLLKSLYFTSFSLNLTKYRMWYFTNYLFKKNRTTILFHFLYFNLSS